MYNLLKEKLIELKQKYGASGLKIEFETECISLDDLFAARNLAREAEIDFVIKIGGCGAVRDIFEAKEAGAGVIVAPMIESVYALKKFVNTVREVYCNSVQIPCLYINIETENGVLQFPKIVSAEEFKEITGVVIGRNDMAKSYEIDDVESDFIRKTVYSIAKMAYECGKIVIAGGKITPESELSFSQSFVRCETRKIVFASIPDKEGILKALEFESLFIENKKNKTSEDYARLGELKTRMPGMIVD